MQGYILNTVKVKDEDMIVTLLTQKRLKTVYRFYGARHASIHLGYKLDFEIRTSVKSSIGMLRDVLHLGSPWLGDVKKFYYWQQFIKLLYRHLQDIEEVDAFYFELLETMNRKFTRQNPIRTLVEGYLHLLSHEGRLHEDFVCFLCNETIDTQTVLTRGFLPAHPSCLFAETFSTEALHTLFATKSTLLLSDHEVEKLWSIVQQGL